MAVNTAGIALTTASLTFVKKVSSFCFFFSVIRCSSVMRAISAASRAFSSANCFFI